MKQKLIPFLENDKSLYFTADFKISKKYIVDIAYELKGNIAEIVIPDIKTNPERLNKLWEQTCFEFFIGEKSKNNYYEVNLSPSKDWNVFAFDDYRKGKRDEIAVKQVKITIKKTNKTFKLSTSLDFSELINSKEIMLGISAMIYKKSEKKQYWAIKHSGDKPDFHTKEHYLTIKL